MAQEHPNKLLLLAIKKGNIEEIEHSIIEGADVNSKYKDKTSLYIACQKNNLGVVRCLLSNGANLEIPDRLNRTPLHISAFLGRLEAIKLLAEKGANLNAQDDAGATPLHYANLNGHSKVAQYLVKHGASTNIKDKNGKIPREVDNQDHIINHFQLLNKPERINIALVICAIACLITSYYISSFYIGLFCVMSITLGMIGINNLYNNRKDISTLTSIVDPECCEVNSEYQKTT